MNSKQTKTIVMATIAVIILLVILKFAISSYISLIIVMAATFIAWRYTSKEFWWEFSTEKLEKSISSVEKKVEQATDSVKNTIEDIKEQIEETKKIATPTRKPVAKKTPVKKPVAKKTIAKK